MRSGFKQAANLHWKKLIEKVGNLPSPKCVHIFERNNATVTLLRPENKDASVNLKIDTSAPIQILAQKSILKFKETVIKLGGLFICT